MPRRVVPALALMASAAVLLAGCEPSGTGSANAALPPDLLVLELRTLALGVVALLGVPVGITGVLVLAVVLRALRAGRPVPRRPLVVGIVVLSVFVVIAATAMIFLIATRGAYTAFLPDP